MAANRSQYILDVIRGVLDDDPAFEVVKVFKDSFTDSRAIVYPFLTNQSTTARYEDGSVAEGRALVTVYVNAKSETDPGATGKGHAVHGDITQKIETRIENLALPVQETHANGSWTTTIQDVYVTSVGGFIDQGQNQIKVEYQLEVQWQTHKN